MNLLYQVGEYAKDRKHVGDSIKIIFDALQRYNPANLCLSLTGGKDSTVVVYLLRYVAITRGYIDEEDELLAFYHRSADCFQEEIDFMRQISLDFKLNVKQYSSKTLKESLTLFKSDHCNLEAIFIGTRSCDLKSGCEQPIFAPTDQGWPAFMRVNPILNWSYKQVWDFILDLKLPFCDLYTKGFTSFGTHAETNQNSALKISDSVGNIHYLPAWFLKDQENERSTRTSSNHTPTS